MELSPKKIALSGAAALGIVLGAAGITAAATQPGNSSTTDPGGLVSATQGADTAEAHDPVDMPDANDKAGANEQSDGNDKADTNEQNEASDPADANEASKAPTPSARTLP
jgi:hypothetical protein